jgi:hypothetical protein
MIYERRLCLFSGKPTEISARERRADEIFERREFTVEMEEEIFP